MDRETRSSGREVRVLEQGTDHTLPGRIGIAESLQFLPERAEIRESLGFCPLAHQPEEELVQGRIEVAITGPGLQAQIEQYRRSGLVDQVMAHHLVGQGLGDPADHQSPGQARICLDRADILTIHAPREDSIAKLVIVQQIDWRVGVELDVLDKVVRGTQFT